MVKKIAEAHGKKIRLVKIFNPFLRLLGATGGRFGGLVNKAFGNMVYERELGIYKVAYETVGFKESIVLTELTN